MRASEINPDPNPGFKIFSDRGQLIAFIVMRLGSGLIPALLSGIEKGFQFFRAASQEVR